MADGGTAGYLEDFRARGEGIAAACTRCGACFKACPMVAPAGLAEAEPEETAGGIIDLITGGAGTAAAVGWASVCSGSGNCIPACPEGIDTRFMVQLARGFARAQTGDRLDQRRLPRARWTDQRRDVRLQCAADGQVEMGQREAEVDLDHAANRFRCCAISSPLAPTSTQAMATT